MEKDGDERLEKSPGGLPQNAQPEKTYKTSDPRPHQAELDGLRGIAILMTVITHITSAWVFALGKPLYVPLLRVDLVDLLFFGYLAVPMFFLLSGYLLTWTEEARRRRGSYSILNYAKRRVLRIVPAYYAAIAVVTPTYIFIGPILTVPPPSLRGVVLHLTFLHGFLPSYPEGFLDLAWWSLTPEIVFYAVLPLLVLKFRKLSERAVILAVLVALSLLTRLLQAYNVFGLLPLFYGNLLGQDRMHFFPTTYLYLFLVGMLLRMMVERHVQAGAQRGRRHLFLASAMTLIPTAVLLVFPYLVMRRDEILHHPATMIPEAMIISLFASVLLGSPLLKPLVRWRPLAFIGEISFSLFLLHGTLVGIGTYYAQDTVRALLADQSELIILVTFLVFTTVMLTISGIVGYLSYRYIESPFMRYKPK